MSAPPDQVRGSHDQSEFPDPGMRWLRSWPRDSGSHLAVIKDAETLVWDEECKVGSLITRGGIADITLHLTLVMTNSLRVNLLQPRVSCYPWFLHQRAGVKLEPWASGAQ